MNFFNRRSSAGDEPNPSLLKPSIPPLRENWMKSNEFCIGKIDKSISPRINSRYDSKRSRPDRSGSETRNVNSLLNH